MAKTIGELEGLDRHTQEVLELAAVVHDIACPLCREKYGNASGKNQERESGYSRPAIEKTRQRVFRTAAGLRLLDSMYLGEGEEDEP